MTTHATQHPLDKAHTEMILKAHPVTLEGGRYTVKTPDSKVIQSFTAVKLGDKFYLTGTVSK